MARTSEQDAWIARVLGVDLPIGPGSAGGHAENATGSSPTSQRSFLERVKQAGPGGIAVVRGKVGWLLPTTAPTAAGPVISITSETEATLPSPRSRRRLGVGERVVLTVTGETGGTWSVTGATLSATSGVTQVTMTAPNSPGKVSVSVTVAGSTATQTFQVIAPSEVHMDPVRTYHLNNGFPNAGLDAQVYIGPSDVNFGATTNYEEDVAAVASGYWAPFKGKTHDPNPTPNGCDPNTVVSGKGTLSPGVDQLRSGFVSSSPKGGKWTGQHSFAIPWKWRCGSASGSIQTVVHLVRTDAAGTTTISKAGASHTAARSP